MATLSRDQLTGRSCAYCNAKTICIDSAEIYNGTSYGNVYICRPCKAWVGTHRNQPHKPLGRVATEALRHAKKEAHAYFDNVWLYLMRARGWSKHDARTWAYDWLHTVMETPREYTHIGMFDEAQCAQVVVQCKRLYKELKPKKEINDDKARL